MELLTRAQQFFAFQDKRDLTTASNSGNKRPPTFRTKYGLGKVLGKGTYSVVRKGIDLKTSERVAVKCIQEEELNEKDAQSLQREIMLLGKLDHPNIIGFRQCFHEETEKMYYIVTEYCDGGELFDAIVENVYYAETVSKAIALTLSKAVKFCHDKNIVHRDLKPENILLKHRTIGGEMQVEDIKIADFGFAKQITKETGLTTICGSPIYVAPEIISKNQYGKGVDVWSLGIIFYILLCGYPPFNDQSTDVLFSKIKGGKFSFDPQYWDAISASAKDLIEKMLVVDPSKRYTIDDVLNHTWLSNKVNRTNRVDIDIETRNDQFETKAEEAVILEDDISKNMSKGRWKISVAAVKAVTRIRHFSSSSSSGSSSYSHNR